MVFGLVCHRKYMGPNQFEVQVPPQVIGAAHDKNRIRVMLNHIRVKAAQKSTGGITADTAVDNFYIQAVRNL